MKKQILALVPLVFCFAAGIEATPITYFTNLLGTNENPPNASPGTGFAAVTLDVVAHTLTIDVNFTGLTGVTTVSHIHCCIADPGNAGVATTTPTFPGFPAGVMAGSYFHIFDTTLASSFNPAFITSASPGGTVANAEARLEQQLLAGRAYFNIHTGTFPGGEIRGFLAKAPEPGTLGLIVLGLGTLAAATRKRRA